MGVFSKQNRPFDLFIERDGKAVPVIHHLAARNLSCSQEACTMYPCSNGFNEVIATKPD